MYDQRVIEIYQGLSNIEDNFKVSKSDLGIRPVYVSRLDRINAHVFYYFIFLVILRFIQNDYFMASATPNSRFQQHRYTLSATAVFGKSNGLFWFKCIGLIQSDCSVLTNSLCLFRLYILYVVVICGTALLLSGLLGKENAALSVNPCCSNAYWCCSYWVIIKKNWL